MPITTTVEFFLNDKTEYNEVVLYPDGTIDFPGYDIDYDIMAAELGDEPTQQYDLYNAWNECGIFGFTLVGKEQYFISSDYYKLAKNKKEKKKWADFICRTLGLYMENYDLYKNEILFTATVLEFFAETFEEKQKPNGCHADGERGKTQFVNCESSLYINDKKCLDLVTRVYADYGDSKPGSLRKWGFHYSDHYSDKYWHNVTDTLETATAYRIEKENGDKEVRLRHRRIEHIPEPFEYLDEFSDFNPFDGFKDGEIALVIFYNDDENVFVKTYNTVEQAENSLRYIYKWFKLRRPAAELFIKEDENAEEFNIWCHGDYPDSWEITKGWNSLGFG